MVGLERQRRAIEKSRWPEGSPLLCGRRWTQKAACLLLSCLGSRTPRAAVPCPMLLLTSQCPMPRKQQGHPITEVRRLSQGCCKAYGPVALDHCPAVDPRPQASVLVSDFCPRVPWPAEFDLGLRHQQSASSRFQQQSVLLFFTKSQC